MNAIFCFVCVHMIIKDLLYSWTYFSIIIHCIIGASVPGSVLLPPIFVHQKQWHPLEKVQHSRDYRDTKAKSGHPRKVFKLLVFACLCQQWKLDGGRGIDWCREANIRDGLETVPLSLISVQKPAVGAVGVIPPPSPPPYFPADPWIFHLKTT
jgi:hypothetical protein